MGPGEVIHIAHCQPKPIFNELLRQKNTGKAKVVIWNPEDSIHDKNKQMKLAHKQTIFLTNQKNGWHKPFSFNFIQDIATKLTLSLLSPTGLRQDPAGRDTVTSIGSSSPVFRPTPYRKLHWHSEWVSPVPAHGSRLCRQPLHKGGVCRMMTVVVLVRGGELGQKEACR